MQIARSAPPSHVFRAGKGIIKFILDLMWIYIDGYIGNCVLRFRGRCKYTIRKTKQSYTEDATIIGSLTLWTRISYGISCQVLAEDSYDTIDFIPRRNSHGVVAGRDSKYYVGVTYIFIRRFFNYNFFSLTLR